MINVRGLVKSFGMAGTEPREKRVFALHGISLSIAVPGFYAVMGPSGSGKSTLLHLLAGLDRPDEGEIIVNDQPVHSMSEKELTVYRRRSVGIVFQRFNLIATMDALTNVMLPGLLDRRPSDELRARALELCEQFGLSKRLHHRPDALSGGEQQRVAIARAMLFEPGVLLADEPTGNLDSHSSEQIWTTLRELATTRDMMVVMVTHEPAAAAYCRHAYILQDGKITSDFEIEQHDARWLADRYQQSQC